MTEALLGQLEQVPLRIAWANEAGDFTPWLAGGENLGLLGNAIGVDLQAEGTEQSVGPFSADILAQDGTGKRVVIENQLEKTDHSHLGQLITYAAGLDAATIIWVAERFTDEHRAALDWLNRMTSDEVNAFGVEVELWRIGDSLPAPRFNVVSKPNNWTRTVAATARRLESGELNATQEQYLAYWAAFRQYLEDQGSSLRPPPARPTHEMDFGLGRSGILLRARITAREPWVQAAVVLNDAKRGIVWFRRLAERRDEIDRDLGFSLHWQQRDGVLEHRLAVRLNDADFRNQRDWPRQYAWLCRKLEALQRVFQPLAKQLPADIMPIEGNQAAEDIG